MTKYTVEVIHDPTNTAMTFVLDTDDNDVLDEVFDNLSITALEIEE